MAEWRGRREENEMRSGLAGGISIVPVDVWMMKKKKLSHRRKMDKRWGKGNRNSVGVNLWGRDGKRISKS